MEDFNADTASLLRQYKELPEDCQDNEILADFQRRWESSGRNLELRLNRGKI